uniref:Putative secreted protein n=1 Tax=Ixodes ricinus TaxID=34613 RepID=A0A6B0TQV7_IXORI
MPLPFPTRAPTRRICLVPFVSTHHAGAGVVRPPAREREYTGRPHYTCVCFSCFPSSVVQPGCLFSRQ